MDAFKLLHVEITQIHWDAAYCSVTADTELLIVTFWPPVHILLFLSLFCMDTCLTFNYFGSCWVNIL